MEEAILDAIERNPDPPMLEFVARGFITVDKPRIVGRAGPLARRVVPITGGRFEGPRFRAAVLPGGADWQIDDGEGVLDVDARYLVETDDGVTISIVNRGLRSAEPSVMARLAAGETVSPDEYYFRTTPAFDAPPGPYGWLRESIFVAVGRRDPAAVSIEIFRVC